MKKVITYGTFDMFHVGHYNMLQRAKSYGDYLIVGVTGETYDVGRGKLSVRDSLAERIENVQKTGLADQIIVEEYLGQKIDDISRYDVDTFVIGDDWKGKFDHIAKYCNLVYLERTEGISSTMLREENYTKYSVGIITDYLDDNQLINECKQIVGFSVDSIFSKNEELRNGLCKQFGEIDTITDSMDVLLEKSDLVYIHTLIPNRAKYIKTALESGKHVICDSPFSLRADEETELFNMAKERQLILMEDIKMVHIHVFNQLLWMAQSGIIGDVISFNCSISRYDSRRTNMFFDLLTIALCPMVKIMDGDYEQLDIITRCENNEIKVASLDFRFKNSRATLNIGDSIRVKNQIEIVGTKGTIRSDGNWWRGNRFELERANFGETEFYCTNYSGNGFKYKLRTILNMLKSGTTETKGISEKESIKIVEIIENVINSEK